MKYWSQIQVKITYIIKIEKTSTNSILTNVQLITVLKTPPKTFVCNCLTIKLNTFKTIKSLNHVKIHNKFIY